MAGNTHIIYPPPKTTVFGRKSSLGGVKGAFFQESPLKSYLQHVKINAEEMQDASRKDEEMPYRMEVFLFACKEGDACGIGDAAGQQERGTPKSQGGDHFSRNHQNTPAHGDIRDHREDLVFL